MAVSGTISPWRPWLEVRASDQAHRWTGVSLPSTGKSRVSGISVALSRERGVLCSRVSREERLKAKQMQLPSEERPKENTVNRIASLVLALGLTLVPVSVLAEGDLDASSRDFGAPIQLDTPTPLSKVLAHPDRYAEEPILIAGRIADVCQRKGCWTVLAEGDAVLRIRFKDYGFFLPKDIHGQFALAEGRVQLETQSQETARHYAEESLDGNPEAIVGAQRVVAFIATGVRLTDSDR